MITGASSGVARASALAFAAHGCGVVLAARGESALLNLADECRAAGGKALVVPTDVGLLPDMERLGRLTVEAYGRIDVWVEAAGVLLAGPFGQEPIEEVERLVATNVMGAVHGARVALAQFRSQGYGTLINVSSLLGVVQNPVVPLYVMTKFAVRGLSLSLHHATRHERGIRVCTVLPGPLDTELFERAANHSGRVVRAVPPACSPERGAAAIVSCARRPRRQVVVGGTGKMLLAVPHRVAPAATELVVALVTGALVVRRDPAPEGPGAVFTTAGSGSVSANWRRGRLRRAAGDALGRALARRGSGRRSCTSVCVGGLRRRREDLHQRSGRVTRQ